MLPPIQLKYFFYVILKILTALTFALGGANDDILEKTTSEVSENKILPPELWEVYLSLRYLSKVLS